MAFVIVRQYWSAILVIGLVAINMLAYFFPTSFLEPFTFPITAMFVYSLACMIAVLPWFKKRPLVFGCIALIIGWAATWWFYFS